MPSVTNRAQPALNFIPPNYSDWVRRLMRPLMPAWTAWKTNVAEVETQNIETLANVYQEFAAGKTRVLLAFRHPNAVDPYVLSHLLWQELPRTARQMGLDLGPTHSHFMYDRGIPLWAGNYITWVFARLGGVPIQRGKLDLMALKTARKLLLDGQFPLAVAPEGGNNGHNEIISPLEPGIAQLAFWCAEDLKAAQRPESVVVLPIGIQYRYVEEPWAQLGELISQMETDSGIGKPNAEETAALQEMFVGSEAHADLYRRLYRLAEHFLTLMEGYYTDFYGMSFESPEGGVLGVGDAEPNVLLGDRLQTLMNKSLQVAENYFDIRPKGSTIDRCRKLEQAGWDRIFREDTLGLSPVELGLADRVAEEADLRMWHMRLVESFVAVTGCYVKEHPSVDRFAETALLLHGMVAKIKGERKIKPQLGLQKAIVTIGQPIEVTERLAGYKKKRRGAIAQLTQDLQSEMESLIINT